MVTSNAVYEMSVTEIRSILKRFWLLFICTVVIAMAMSSLYFLNKKQSYQWDSTVQVRIQSILLLGYQEDASTIIDQVKRKYASNHRFTLDVQQTMPGILEFSAVGTSKKQTLQFLITVTKNFVKTQNKPGVNLLRMYTRRISELQNEIAWLNQEERDNVKELSKSDQVKLEATKFRLKTNLFEAKRDRILIPWSAKLITAPHLEKSSLGFSIRYLALILFIGLFAGLIAVFFADYFAKALHGYK